jgi:type I restriction enzyme S subunit
MSFNEDWKEVRLKDLTTDGKGHYGINASAVEYSEDLPTYLRITDITDDCRINKNGLKSVDEENAEEYYLKENDIVFARTGNSTGRSYLYKKEDGEFVFAGFLIKFNLDEEKANPKFIELYTMTNKYENWVDSFATGSTRKNINAKMYGNMKIKLPPRNMQDKIVNIINPLNTKIKNNNKMNKTLEEMAQAIYKNWFVDFESFQEEEFVYNKRLKKEIPKSFNVSTIGKELRVELGGTPLRREEKYWENGNINWIKSGKVNEFRITQPSEHITKEGLENSSTVLLPKGTVVLAITGATLGQVSKLEIESCANQSVVGVVESKKIPSEYIYLWLLHRINIIIQKQTGGAQQHINKTNVKNSLLLLPPEKIMNNFVKLIRPIFNRISNNCFANESIKQLRDSLLPKLMSGEIRVPLEEKEEVEALV